jgi:hypothetical protein
MLRRIAIAVFASLLLAACGRGSEDFTVKVARPADKVEAAFDKIGLDSGITTLFPGLKVVRSNPADNEVLYSLPDQEGEPATIKLTFEAAGDGKETVVHAAIDVPSTTVKFDGKDMVISESKVEEMVRGLLRSAARKLEKGASVETERRDFSRILTVLAIITDPKQMRLANDISKYPDWYMQGLGWLGGIGDGPAYPYGDGDFADDPGAAARQDEYKQKQSEREAQSDADENTQPMDDAKGDSARGDYAGGSDF